MADTLDTRAKALAAARWALDLEDDAERRRLFQGHRERRIHKEHGGLPVTDFTAADKWLVEQHAAAAAQD